MNEKTARKILGKAIRENDTVYNNSHMNFASVDLVTTGGIRPEINGILTLNQLEALLWWFKNKDPRIKKTKKKKAKRANEMDWDWTNIVKQLDTSDGGIYR